jgi:uncharacterized protein (DUF58 family)
LTPTGISLELVWRPTPRLRRLAMVGALAVIGAVSAASGALLVLAVVPLVLLVLGPRAGLPVATRLQTSVSTERCVEGDEVELVLSVAMTGLDEVRASVSLPDLVSSTYDGQVDRCDGTVSVRWTLRPERWGRQELGPVRLRFRGGAGCWAATGTVGVAEVVVYPEAGALARAVAPRNLPAALGEHPSRSAGSGVEFHGVRGYSAGDRQRDVDWRTSARHGDLFVRQYAAERAFDLVLVLDTAGDPGPPGRSALDLTVRAASGLAQSYLRSHDRVGLLTFGGPLHWLTPATGPRQLFQVHEALMGIRPSRVERDAGRVEYGVDALPSTMLPPRSFIVLLTPLLDRRPLDAVRVLRERGFSPLVLDVLTNEPAARSGSEKELAVRVWRLQRDAWRHHLAELGVPVLRWDGTSDLTAPLQHAMRARRGGLR